MAFDYKKEYKALYMPESTPAVVDVPVMKFIAVNGAGNPNDPDGEYQKALGMLYPVAYAIKMSYKTDTILTGSLNMLCRRLKACGGQTMP